MSADTAAPQGARPAGGPCPFPAGGAGVPVWSGMWVRPERVLAALGTADPEQLADATLNALGEPLPADQVCRVCGYRLDPWLVQRGHTTHLEDPL